MSAKKLPVLVETDVQKIPNIIARVRDGFESHNGWSVEQHMKYRLHQLQQMKKMLEENEKKICDAVWIDLRKNHMEGNLLEYTLVYNDLITAIRDLDEWMKPRPVEKDLLNKMNTIYLQPEPYGTVLIISPWNYPFQLAMLPCIGAIAAGNSIVLKAGENAIATSNLLAELIPKYLDNDFFTVITGGVEVSQTVLKERFDYIFYTGSTAVGRIVMRAAAENLTPVTLELGGKSPVIIADDANIDVAARRIIWGKYLNAGQTCIAPDYILCSPGKRERLVEMMRKTIVEFYGSEDPSQCKDYGRIISTRHYQRVCKLMDSSQGRNVLSGSRDEGDCFIAPAVYVDVTSDDPLMQEEIFGPVLPIITVDNIEEAIKFINNREKPLAFYVFTENKKTLQMVSNRTSSGALVHNDTLIYGGVNTLPFGGVGHSGIGAYHGKHTFETFTHLKPVYSTGTGLEAINKIRYPPFNATKLSRMKWLMTPSSRRSRFGSLFTVALVVVAAALLYKVFGVPSWVYNYTK